MIKSIFQLIKKNKRGDYKPAMISLGIILILGGLLPLILQDFVDVGTYDYTGFMEPIINLVENGIELFGFEINVFGIFGEAIQTFLVNQLIVFALIPSIIAIPLIIIIIFGFIYTLIKLLPWT